MNNLSNWGFAKFDLSERWPRDASGDFEEPAFLRFASELDMEADMLMNLLEAYSIPVVCKYANNGDFGRVIMGTSGTGVELYVPKSLLEDARDILSSEAEEETEEEHGV